MDTVPVDVATHNQFSSLHCASARAALLSVSFRVDGRAPIAGMTDRPFTRSEAGADGTAPGFGASPRHSSRSSSGLESGFTQKATSQCACDVLLPVLGNAPTTELPRTFFTTGFIDTSS